MVVCLTSARFNMRADVLRQGHGNPVDPTDEDGEWVYQQDPDSGELIRVWQPNPESPNAEPGTPVLEGFRCLARGIIDGGVRVAGSTERFAELYDNVDFVKITFPKSIIISKRDRITNIRDSQGNIVWRDYELPESPPTVYNVNGVTPILDPFGRCIEQFALIEKVQIA